jgi:hypothetical protein
MKICSACNVEKELTEFWQKKPRCKPCTNANDKAKRASGEWKTKAKNSWKYEKTARNDLDRTGRFILKDSRNTDKKRGLANDLDRPFVDAMISQPCSYCGDTALRMTLDRINNEIGHTKANVVPACYRCNIIRRDMPYEAWLRFRDVLRRTREDGLFGDWQTKPMARKSVK